jgi:hypothetical protein
MLGKSAAFAEAAKTARLEHFSAEVEAGSACGSRQFW